MGVPGHRLDRMFNPKTVVVIGDKGPGYMWLRNNMPFKEQGGNLYSVQIDETQIPGIEELGITNFKSLNDIPEPVDMVDGATVGCFPDLYSALSGNMPDQVISLMQLGGPTVFAPFSSTTSYFGRPEQQWMINFRVRDLDAMVAQLRRAGIDVTVDPETYPNGRFARLKDPEGNPIQLWQPAP